MSDDDQRQHKTLRAIGILSTMLSNARIDGSMTPTSSGRSGAQRRSRVARRRVAVAAGLSLALALGLGTGVPSGRAGTSCTLSVDRAEAEAIHASRAFFAATGKSSADTVHYAFEYSVDEEGKEGSWSPAGSGLGSVGDFNGSVGQYIVGVEAHGLKPDTKYFGRVFAENGCALIAKRFEFHTSQIAAPEVKHLQIRQDKAETSVGLKYADYEAEVESNGANTEYRFEYNTTSPEGPWPEAAAPGEGTSGSVTAAEDFTEAKAHITGLSAHTTYYLRVVAVNSEGQGTASIRFLTPSEYPEAFMGAISDVQTSSARVRATIRPRSAETNWRFEYATSESGPWTPGAEGTIGSGEADEGFHEVEGELTGLGSATTYYVRVHADNGHPPAAESTPPKIFETAGPPVASTFATHTYAPGGATVRLLGSVQPRGYDTRYYFEYVDDEEFASTEWSTASRTLERDAGDGAFVEPQGFPVEIVGEDLPGLQAGKKYHYRIVASSIQGASEGAGETLTSAASNATPEPKCANSALRSGASGRLPDCRAYEQVTPSEKAGSMDNWVYSGNVSTPVLVGEDGDHVLVRPQFSKWGSSADATNSSYVLARNGEDGWQATSATPQPQAGANSYRPELFSRDLTQMGVSVGWSTGVSTASHTLELVVGRSGGPYTPVTSAARTSVPGWLAASPDFGTLIFNNAGNLYEWTNGQAHQVNGGCLATMASARSGGAPGGAVAEGGTRVFFEAASGGSCAGPDHLYVRERGETTTDIGAYRFLAANAQGSSLLLEAVEGGIHSYIVYTVSTKSAKQLFSGKEQLHLLASRDLSSIYVVSKEILAGGAPPMSPGSEYAGPSPQNLYRYDMQTEKMKFVIQASKQTEEHISADGRYYYFQATGVAAVFREDDPGASDENGQIYRYDSDENLFECISCASPFRPRPQRFSAFTNEEIEQTLDGAPPLVVASDNGDYVFFDTAAALVPQDVNGEVHPCVVNTCDAIDENGNHDFFYSVSSDVYEWRRAGVDGCAEGQGCIALVSSGAEGLKNVFLGTTDSGKDVFFATHSQLVGGDTDNQGDVYDARVGGGFTRPSSGPSECGGDACLNPVAAPIDTTPTSLVFSGSGNAKPVSKPALKRCKKGTVRRKGRCVRRKAVRRSSRHRRARSGKRQNAGSHR